MYSHSQLLPLFKYSIINYNSIAVDMEGTEKNSRFINKSSRKNGKINQKKKFVKKNTEEKSCRGYIWKGIELLMLLVCCLLIINIFNVISVLIFQQQQKFIFPQQNFIKLMFFSCCILNFSIKGLQK